MSQIRPATGQHVQATWNGTVLADSDQTIIVEGNHYFPPDSVRADLLKTSDAHSVCPWKGTASYYDVVLQDGASNPGAAWFYPQPKDAAAEIRDYVAFWRGVDVGAAAQ